jgi:hypothetical protein
VFEEDRKRRAMGGDDKEDLEFKDKEEEEEEEESGDEELGDVDAEDLLVVRARAARFRELRERHMVAWRNIFGDGRAKDRQKILRVDVSELLIPTLLFFFFFFLITITPRTKRVINLLGVEILWFVICILSITKHQIQGWVFPKSFLWRSSGSFVNASFW